MIMSTLARARCLKIMVTQLLQMYRCLRESTIQTFNALVLMGATSTKAILTVDYSPPESHFHMPRAIGIIVAPVDEVEPPTAPGTR